MEAVLLAGLTEMIMIESVREINDSPGRRSIPISKMFTRSLPSHGSLVGMRVGVGCPKTAVGTGTSPSWLMSKSLPPAAASTGFTGRFQTTWKVR